VTLENVFLVGGEKAGEKREMCHVHFGFDDRRGKSATNLYLTPINIDYRCPMFRPLFECR
jgi:hypothetical protein